MNRRTTFHYPFTRTARPVGNPLLEFWRHARAGRLPPPHLPFADEVTTALARLGRMDGLPRALVEAVTRDVITPRYAWAVPDDAALDLLAGLGPLVEIGAGTGYWAALLRARGVRVTATDARPYRNEYCAMRWTRVVRADARRAAARAGPSALLLCWAPPLDPMALHALEGYSGRTVALVSDGPGGSTAEDAFFERLERAFVLRTARELPAWSGTRATLTIHEAHAE